MAYDVLARPLAGHGIAVVRHDWLAGYRRGGDVAKSPDRLAVASSLATVAIAALGGPIPAMAAGVREVVKHAEALFRRNQEVTAVQRSVAQAIAGWAESERVRDADLGIDLATRIVAIYGASERERAKLDYDEDRLTELVWVRASTGEFTELATYAAEDRVTAAHRAITITYHSLNSQLGTKEPLLPAIIELLTQIHSYADPLRRIEEKIDDLPERVADAQSRAWELFDRLAVRLRDSIRPGLGVGSESLELERPDERAGLARLMRTVGESGVNRPGFRRDSDL